MASDTGKANAVEKKCRPRTLMLPPVNSAPSSCSEALNLKTSARTQLERFMLRRPLLDGGMATSVGHAAVKIRQGHAIALGVSACTEREFSGSVRIQSLKMHPRVQHVLRP